MEQKWIVDPIPDASGFWTIRIADGSDHGNLEEQPIATAYTWEAAERIVKDHNGD